MLIGFCMTPKKSSFSVNKNEILIEQNVTDRFDIANVIMILNF